MKIFLSSQISLFSIEILFIKLQYLLTLYSKQNFILKNDNIIVKKEIHYNIR